MSIEFSQDRWAEVKENSRLWWAGKLKRPLIQIHLKGRDPGRPEPLLKRAPRVAHYDFAIPAEQVVDRFDYDLCCTRFMGDAFPYAKNDFGPGVPSIFLGARPELGDNTVWFFPDEEREIRDVHFHYNSGHPWVHRIKDIYRAAVNRWGGSVQLCMSSLSGAVDILSIFRPSERLLYDLCEYPEDVKRLTWDIYGHFWRVFDEFDAIYRPTAPGYSSWCVIFSPEPYMMLQCDFAYMLGPDHFDEFVKPEIVASCKRLKNSFYHLDGVGQLRHLDSLLAIPELKGIQWIPGAGQPELDQWPEVYRKIHDAGKLIQLLCYKDNRDILDTVVKQIGGAEGIVYHGVASISQEDEIKDYLSKYGVR